MRLSLTTKLVAALFSMSAVMVALVVVWAGWALDDRFSAYLGTAILANMDRTVAMLEQAYQANAGWSGVEGHPAAWEAALLASLPQPTFPSGPASPGPPVDGSPGGWPPPGRLGAPPGFQPGPPFDPSSSYGRRGAPLGLTLVDASGKFVAGAPLERRGRARRQLTVGGKPIGALLFLPPTLPGPVESAFLSERERDLHFAGAMALVLSGVWAVVLARYILAPVRQVASGARRLAEGHLSTRIASARHDELGDLVGDFNRLAAALDAAEQARRSWVADTSHELRTPLAVLRAQIEALQDGVHQAGIQSFGRLHDEVLRMSRLVDDLHELARADSHALGLRLEPIRPSDVMAEVLCRFEPRRAASKLHLDKLALGRSKSIVMADPDRLRQVFANLVENAIRYTDPGGLICVSETHGQGAIILKVEDTSPGVPEDKLSRLFERFFRVDSSRSRQTGGSGLGLAICKAIIEAHAGSISAAPSPLGGLAVSVALPVAGGSRL
jgi:two-component system sensor histidine kinase BaeS